MNVKDLKEKDLQATHISVKILSRKAIDYDAKFHLPKVIEPDKRLHKPKSFFHELINSEKQN